MPYAVELALDSPASAVVQQAWEALADAGFMHMAQSGAAPHVSLAIWDVVEDLDALERRLRSFAGVLRPVPVTFDRVGVFTGGVVYLAPSPSVALREAHQRFHAMLGSAGQSLWHHYAPRFWMPHCTLGMEIEPAEVERARIIADGIPLPLAGRLDSIGLVEFRPVRERVRYPLTGR